MLNSRTQLEDGFLTVWRCVFNAKYPLPEREYRFHESRRWRLDFAWPEFKLGVEIQGGQWRQRGAHVGGYALQRDCEKSNALTEADWHIFTYTTQHIVDAPVPCVEQVAKKLAELMRQ